MDEPLTHTLSTGLTITLRSRDSITERLSRIMTRAYVRSVPVAAKLEKSGVDPEKPETWGAVVDMSDAELDALEAYKLAAIQIMVVEPDFSPAGQDPLDLDPAVFNELANYANAAWRGELPGTEPVDTGLTPGADGQPDPLAQGGSSTG